MTWDQIWAWLIWPGIATVVLCVAGIYAAKKIP